MKSIEPPTPNSSLKLAVFDLDGTLNQIPSPYGYVHRALRVHDKAARILARYRSGELSYVQWGEEEIALWRGLQIERLIEIVSEIPYWPGAREFVRRLKARGVAVALVSAGFDVHVRRCAAELGVDHAYFNRLGVADGLLTGEFWAGVNADNKGELVRELQARFGATRSETLVAGDTDHDASMFPEAALRIAVAPEPALVAAADLLLTDGDWRPVWGMIEAVRPGWLPPSIPGGLVDSEG
jgi:phosphoserine phosphatase